MRPFTLSQTGVGSSDSMRVNYMQSNFKIGFGVVVIGTVNYTVQHTFDDPSGPDFASATWFDNADVANATTNQDGNYFFPFQAVRITVNSGTGTATGTFIQGSEA